MAAKLHCPNCGSSILGKDINIQKLIAKCDNCHTVFDFDQKEMVPVKLERPNIELPTGFDVLRMVSEMSISVNWRKTRHLFFYVLFTVIWNLVTIPFILIAIWNNDGMMALMISVHAIIGISFLLYTLALLFNNTVIDVSPHGLTVVTKPITVPFNPNRYIEVRDLEQLYVEEYVASRTNGRPNYAYAVRAVVKGNQKRPRIVKGLKKEEQALFIEHEIEKFLHIDDKIID